MDNAGATEAQREAPRDRVQRAGLSRRQFIALVAGSGLAAVLAACEQKPAPPASKPASAPASQPAPTPAAAAKWEPVWKDGKLQPLPDGFPNGPITLWNQWAPGHGDEVYSRTIMQAAVALSPVALSVDSANTGAIATWGMANKMKTLPRYREGYHLVGAALPAMGVHYWTGNRGGLTLDDIGMVIGTEDYTLYIIVKEDAPWKSLKELVDYSKANPAKVRYGGAVGTGLHMMVSEFMDQAGINWTFVPHSSTTDALVSLLGGGIEVTSADTATIFSYFEKKQARGIAAFGTKRSPTSPDVPLATEFGYTLTSFEGGRGFWTSSAVPKDRIRWLFELLKKAAEQQVYQDRLKTTRQYQFINDGDYLITQAKAVADKIGPVIKRLGLAAEQK